MKTFELQRGLDVPITGDPQQTIHEGRVVSQVALVGDDYIGMKPTMEVGEGDRVKTGQLLFVDKKNEGIRYISPATGTIAAINRGAKRKFESIVIDMEEADDHITFLDDIEKSPGTRSSEEIRSILLESGMWSSFRTRPYGKIPPRDDEPAAVFITVMDTRPHAADPAVIIDDKRKEFDLGLEILAAFTDKPKYLCLSADGHVDITPPDSIEPVAFRGPHPAGLPSTHIHLLDHATEARVIWHIDYQDVIGLGHLFTTGQLPTTKVVSLAGPFVKNPRLLRVRQGASLEQVCGDEIEGDPVRIVSGSIIDGRKMDEYHKFLGRYHHQISALPEGSGRALFNWGMPGGDRFSVKNIFSSALDRTRKFAMNTALWGGERAIYPLDSYARVMPLDIIPLELLKAIAVCDTEKSRNLGALELIEDDLALLTFVCPGKNNFAPMLREVLTEIEQGG